MICATRRIGLAAAVLGLLAGGAGTAGAGFIAGPSLLDDVNGHASSGIRFTALADATLRSFIFRNQGGADTIQLLSPGRTVLYSLATPAGDPSFLARDLGWALTAGEDYLLLATAYDPTRPDTSNGKWGISSDLPISNADLRVHAGVFGSELYGEAWGTFNAWGAFNDITTETRDEPHPNPEPSTLMLGLVGAALAGAGWMRRRAAA